MADGNTDQSQKTEEPTQKKLSDAHRKGQVASSREVNHWFMILAGTLIVMMLAPHMMSDIKNTLRTFIAMPHAIPTDRNGLFSVLGVMLSDIAVALVVPLLLLLTAAVASSLVQHGFLLAPEKIKPSLDKLSLIKGFKRMFSMKSLAEFAKGILKLSIVAAVAAMLMMPELTDIERIVSFEPIQMLDLLHSLIIRLLIGVVAIVTVIAVLDFMYQKFEHNKTMMMSRQEIKDELKQSEGDPIVKQRLRQIRQERARKRMMAAVPDASVVITNPTHYAVALKYQLNVMAAPVVVAKGIDDLALRIRAVAKESDVPVVENPPVAQALYAGVEIDEPISEEHFKAVAEIIGYVMRLKGELPVDGRPAG